MYHAIGFWQRYERCGWELIGKFANRQEAWASALRAQHHFGHVKVVPADKTQQHRYARRPR
jgi:hypothetical protein